MDWLNLFLVGLLAFMIWMTFTRVKENFSYRIMFTGEAIEENHSLGFASSLPRRIRYSEIQSVRYVFPDTIIVRSKNEDKFKFVLADIEGGAGRVLELLKTHLPTTVIGEKLPEVVERNSFLAMIANAGMVLLLCLMILPAVYSYGLLRDGWNVHRLPWSEFLLEFSIDPQNSLWVASTDFNGDNLIIRFDDQEQRWPFPMVQNSYRTIVLADSQGQPTIIADESNYTWQDGRWLQWKYFGVYHAVIYDEKSVVSTAENAWLILHGDHKPNVLVRAAGGEPGADVIELPESAVQKGYEPYSLSILPDETVLVHAGNENETRIFLLRDGQWLEKSYDVPFDAYQVQDFVIDDTGHLFILYAIRVEEAVSFFVQIQDDKSTLVTELPRLDEKYSYDFLLVDPLGRLWASGDSYRSEVAVMQPVWGGIAELIIRYNGDNSNYPKYVRSSPVLGVDGKVWASDEDLFWIDSTASELPRPMPDWLAGFSDFQAANRFNYIMIVSAVFFGGYIVLSVLSMKEPKK